MISNDIHDNQNELVELKELLFTDQLDQIKALESKIETLDFEASDDATIMKRVAPAISKGIAANKDTMIDALYPIMGGMISKYVTQAIKEIMETINKKIENGLSFENYKRKVRAKLSGVSETEILLEESSTSVISSLFVIHKESSLLIAEAHLKDKEIDDAHMVASMASAIKDFINDWIKNNESRKEVQILSYGDATLYIESAGSVYIIAFLDTEPDYEQRSQINAFFAKIVKKYAMFFQKFDGDDSADEITTLSMKMENYLYAHQSTTKEEKKNPAKYILIFIAFLLFGYAAYVFNAWYIRNSLENTVYSQTGEHISISSKNDSLVLNGQVSSTDVVYEIEKIMKRHSQEMIKNNLLVPMIYIDKRINAKHNLDDSSVNILEKKLLFLEKNFDKSVNGLEEKILTLSKELKKFEDSKEHLNKLLKSRTDEISILQNEKAQLKKIAQIKNEIFTRLDNAFSEDKFYNKQDHSLDFRKMSLFTVGNTEYKKEMINTVSEVFTKYMSILVEYKEYIKNIIIEGHADSSGIDKNNIVLSKKRAVAVKYYLENLSIIKQYHMQSSIKIEAYGNSRTIHVDGLEDRDASRRIKVKFELKESRVLDNLRRIIND